MSIPSTFYAHDIDYFWEVILNNSHELTGV